MADDNLEAQRLRGDFILGEEEEQERDPSIEETEEEETPEEVVEEEEQQDTPEEESLEEDTSDEEEDTSADTKNKDIKIPKSRLDKVIAQREAEKERVQWLEEQLSNLIDKGVGTKSPQEQAPAAPETVQYDFADAEEKYADLILSGESAKAAKLRTEINTKQTEFIMSEVSGLGDKASEAALQQTQTALREAKFEATRDTLETQYSFLDYNSPDFNEEAVDTINGLMTGYVAQGESEDAALRKAVDKMAPLYQTETKEVDTVKAKRATASKAKRVKASNAQPPEVSGTLKEGQSETIDTSKLSRKEFKSLSAKEKAILRGDII